VRVPPGFGQGGPIDGESFLFPRSFLMPVRSVGIGSTLIRCVRVFSRQKIFLKSDGSSVAVPLSATELMPSSISAGLKVSRDASFFAFYSGTILFPIFFFCALSCI